MALGVLLLGKGSMGVIHKKAYDSIPDMQCQVWPERITQPRIQLAQAFQDENVNIVDICLPSHLHAQVAELALEHGKHVFIEKPAVREWSELERLRTAEQNAQAKVMVGHVLRYFPEYRLILERAQAVGEYGMLLAKRRAKSPEGSGNWFLNTQQSGGIILDLALHDIDFARLLFGPVASVFAQTAGLNETYALITLHHENRSVSHIEVSWMYTGGFHARVEVQVGGHHWSHDNHESNPMVVHADALTSVAAVEVPLTPFREDPWTRQIKDFVRCIKEDTKSPISLHDAGESLKVALAAIQSARNKAPVSVSEVS
ncbi:Gfo/Idh/MocA family oxidoreductase [Alicyclobacillus fastidiosus]|uniref:Gfo/Idh/MocA family oxidoreductase n=1 Tax=Alicyclobacillus fastidiosus TaxID=392011 RepID=A0ABY6ZPG1_9BACL|nr:Gfo/Idh/MocA family oxidoreductase [Alicyclobacillus fastidiosus]WAH43961.1 Gfo/Idh/MocA family oxidoreductase [Alicyclobacillus fastidiosus]GMA60216.1 dehydrogenase [Alicyclobacillus fastidiosus]